jgi:hypothetical protein
MSARSVSLILVNLDEPLPGCEGGTVPDADALNVASLLLTRSTVLRAELAVAAMKRPEFRVGRRGDLIIMLFFLLAFAKVAFVVTSTRVIGSISKASEKPIASSAGRTGDAPDTFMSGSMSKASAKPIVSSTGRTEDAVGVDILPGHKTVLQGVESTFFAQHLEEVVFQHEIEAPVPQSAIKRHQK